MFSSVISCACFTSIHFDLKSQFPSLELQQGSDTVGGLKSSHFTSEIIWRNFILYVCMYSLYSSSTQHKDLYIFILVIIDTSV